MTDPRFYEQPQDAGRRHAPAVSRNTDPIAAVLADWLPPRGTVLEVASGTGEHVVAFARRFPHLQWQPSDLHPQALSSIAAWVGDSDSANIAAPLALDVAAPRWPLTRADALVAVNLLHISAWESALGLIEGAARVLPSGAPLILYGPWIERGIAPSGSNLAFDADLRRRDPRWGLREVEAFANEAAQRGFDLAERRAMPANNLMLLLRRR